MALSQRSVWHGGNGQQRILSSVYSLSFLSFFLVLYSGIFGWVEGRVGGSPPTPPLPLRSASCGELLRKHTRHTGPRTSYQEPTALPQARALALSEAASRAATPSGHHH